jgi:thymidylate synthase (FAD)
MVSFIEPRVIKLAETKVEQQSAKLLMKEYGGIAEKWLSSRSQTWASDAEMLIEIAGRVCYRSFGKGLNENIRQIRSESKDYFENVLKKGDGSILEHASVTFALMWVSRVLTHELVRHRVGTAFSQESLRYVRTTKVIAPEWSSWFPVEIPEKAKNAIETALRDIEHHYLKIQDMIPWDTMTFDQKKRATSAIRRILPQGVATAIIFTANHRTLRWLIEMRTDPAAELEIRQAFGQIAKICIKDYPLIYSDFKEIPSADGVPQYKPTLRSKV